jgi:hypothetical protein
MKFAVSQSKHIVMKGKKLCENNYIILQLRADQGLDPIEAIH